MSERFIPNHESQHNPIEQEVSLPSLLEKREGLLQELDNLFKEAPDRRKATLLKYKSGELDLEGFQSQTSEGEAPMELIEQQIRQTEKDIRIQYIEDLDKQYPSDEKRRVVESMVSDGSLQEQLGENMQGGGSNALGVYPVRGTSLLVIEKFADTYDFIGGLPSKLQALPESRRVPRVLSVFVANEKTYQVVEAATGKQLDEMTPEEVAEIPQEHFDLLVEDVEKLNKNGLYIDPSKNSNVFYDPSEGFVLIDLGYNDPFQKAGSSQVDERILRAFLLGGNNQNSHVLEKIRHAISLNKG